jgi:hypothetical protein
MELICGGGWGIRYFSGQGVEPFQTAGFFFLRGRCTGPQFFAEVGWTELVSAWIDGPLHGHRHVHVHPVYIYSHVQPVPSNIKINAFVSTPIGGCRIVDSGGVHKLDRFVRGNGGLLCGNRRRSCQD